MESFFVRVMVAVMTNPKVQEMLHGLIRDATKDVMDGVVNRVDAMDGKMGNLQEQLTDIPGQVVGGVIDKLLERLPFPFGGQQ